MLLGGLWQGVIFLHPLLGFDKPQGGPGGGDGGFGGVGGGGHGGG